MSGIDWLFSALRFVRDLLICAFVVYMLSYQCLAWWGRCERIEIDDIGAAQSRCIWSFQGCRQRFDKYKPGTTLYRQEKVLHDFYYPMVQLDRLRGNYHILDPMPAGAGG